MPQKAAIYARVSTPDQHVETQLCQLRELRVTPGFQAHKALWAVTKKRPTDFEPCRDFQIPTDYC